MNKIIYHKGIQSQNVSGRIFCLYPIVIYISINFYLQLYNTGVGFCADYKPGRATAEGSIELSPCSDSLTQVMYTLRIRHCVRSREPCRRQELQHVSGWGETSENTGIFKISMCESNNTHSSTAECHLKNANVPCVAEADTHTLLQKTSLSAYLFSIFGSVWGTESL